MEPFQRADLTAYRERVARASASLRAMAAGAPPRLDKHSSNLFRAREAGPAQRLDLRDFNHVIRVDEREQFAEVEGLTTYEDLVRETLPFQLMPTVVPQEYVMIMSLYAVYSMLMPKKARHLPRPRVLKPPDATRA